MSFLLLPSIIFHFKDHDSLLNWLDLLTPDKQSNHVSPCLVIRNQHVQNPRLRMRGLRTRHYSKEIMLILTINRHPMNHRPFHVVKR